MTGPSLTTMKEQDLETMAGVAAEAGWEEVVDTVEREADRRACEDTDDLNELYGGADERRW